MNRTPTLLLVKNYNKLSKVHENTLYHSTHCSNTLQILPAANVRKAFINLIQVVKLYQINKLGFFECRLG